MCVVEFKKIKNCGRQQQHPACARMTVATLTRNIVTDFLGREPVAKNDEILSEDHVDCGVCFSERNASYVPPTLCVAASVPPWTSSGDLPVLRVHQFNYHN